MSPIGPIEEETYERNLEWGVWRRLLGFTLRNRREVILFALAGAFVAFVDIAFPLVTRRIVDDLQAGIRPDLVVCGTAYAILTLLLVVNVKVFINLGGRVRTRVAYDIRSEAFANLQNLSFAFFDHRPVGWLMARMTSDSERLSNIMAWGLLDLIWGATMMGGITIVLFTLNAELAAITLAVIPFLLWISVVFQRRILRSSRIVRKTNSRLTASYNEGITGVRTTKVFVREDENLDEFRDLAGEMFSASVRNQLQSALYLPIVMAMSGIAAGLALAFGGFATVEGVMTIGTMIVFLTLGAHFFQPIQELAHWFAEMQMAQASAERVLGLIDEKPEIADSEEVRRRIASQLESPIANAAIDGFPDEIGTIEFRGVGFAYGADGSGQRVLEGFDLTVKAGETVALVGATGGGKSTIVNLLCRFYEPTAGEILIDGIEYRSRSLAWLQSNLGIVLQTPHLFSGTVRENIRYGRLDATDEELEQAARLAGAHDFIMDLEDGYDLAVGEDGNRLSVGQKQLVSFARAVLARPRILVMDEATSSVDTETERRIQAGLRRVLQGRTSFVIAHRLSTTRSADRILVIDRGQIVEQGSHASLLAARGAYYDLYTQQRLRESGRSDEGWDANSAPAT